MRWFALIAALWMLASVVCAGAGELDWAIWAAVMGVGIAVLSLHEK